MIDVRILGLPPCDNSLMVVADSGQSRIRMMFDCGGNTLDHVSHGDIQAITHLFLTHLHMDHISGFDAFFRVNYQRTAMENHIWGPVGTAGILHHRFQGFWWSHAPELSGRWFVHDVDASHIRDYRFEAHEAFATMHPHGERQHNGIILQTAEVQVEAVCLVHHGLCLGYIVRENVRQSVDREGVRALGLQPGPWLNLLKKGHGPVLEINGRLHDADALRAAIIRSGPGDSFAYLTDFLANEEQRHRIAPRLAGVNTLYAEAQYAPEDAELAEKYHHSTVDQIARLARQAGVRRYVLLHLSRRYTAQQWRTMAACAQAIFLSSGYIPEWKLEEQ